VSRGTVAIIGAGPYALSLASHLAAQNVEHRIFGRPMSFWSQIAESGNERYLKSYCFGTNISSPKSGFSFADYSRPRQLETFEPCSIGHFASYGRWFQKTNVNWVEPVDAVQIERPDDEFLITLENGERFSAAHVVMATGLSRFSRIPEVLTPLPSARVSHTSKITKFANFKGQDVAVIGGGQSALEAAALLHEAGARPQLVVRKEALRWQTRVSQSRSFWRRLRSPISGLGSGPVAWALTHLPGVIHFLPEALRTRFVQNHLAAEGAWWLRGRVENLMPIHTGTTVIAANETADRIILRLRDAKDGRERQIAVDHVIAGTGYDVDVDRLDVLHDKIRRGIGRLWRAPSLNCFFESSVPGLAFIGPASAMSFGPLFRFVVGADYAARIVSTDIASRFR
jgi:thioredoxin reductase